jgi:hypothetical protein
MDVSVKHFALRRIEPYVRQGNRLQMYKRRRRNSERCDWEPSQPIASHATAKSFSPSRGRYCHMRGKAGLGSGARNDRQSKLTPLDHDSDDLTIAITHPSKTFLKLEATFERSHRVVKHHYVKVFTLISDQNRFLELYVGQTGFSLRLFSNWPSLLSHAAVSEMRPNVTLAVSRRSEVFVTLRTIEGFGS